MSKTQPAFDHAEEHPVSLVLTPSAAEQVRTALQQRSKGVGLRVGVKTSGCSGLAYVLEFVDAPSSNDELVHSQGVDVYVDPKSSPYLNSTVIDFTDNGIESGFVFRNPNEKARCGCGESFTV